MNEGNSTNSTSSTDNAFDLLVHYSVRSRACAKSAIDIAPIEKTWTGIGFSLGHTAFVASMDDIAEIINLPACTHIPRTKSFVRGAANIRGSIMPVIDLMGFFNKGSSRVARLRRLLVVEYLDSYTGLVVDDILGMQHFPLRSFEPSIESNLDVCFHNYLSGTYSRITANSQDQEHWPVFDIDRLLADESLENLAVG